MKKMHKTQVDYTLYDVLSDNELQHELLWFVTQLILIINILGTYLGFIPKPEIEITDRNLPWIIVIYIILCIATVDVSCRYLLSIQNEGENESK